MADAVEPGVATVWMLKRNCAITPKQFGIFYCSLATVSLSIAAFWTVLGAWTVLPFAGVDVIAIGGAFLVYARHATDYERIAISPGQLIIETAQASRITVVKLNSQWVRIGLERKPRPKIEIRSAGQVFLVGAHVPVHRRAVIAGEMRRHIARLS